MRDGPGVSASRRVLGSPLLAAGTQALVLTIGSAGYGFHRDELYFRMLPPAWGYVDQPPLAPWLARTLTGLVDEPWMLRLPATLASALTVLLLAALAGQLGGDRRARALAAWTSAFATLPLALGHVLLTSTLDLPVTVAVVLVALRALRDDPRWWLAVGGLAGISTLNRLFVPLVVAGLVLGIVLLGPRESLRTRWPWLGALAALALALPAAAYQWTNDWPQLAMGAALSENNAADVRAALPLILLVTVGPLLVPVWVAGGVHVWRIREARWIVVATILVIVFTWVSGAQPHYPVALLDVLLAAGCVPLSRWVTAHRWREALVASVVTLGALVSVVIALPVLPPTVLGRGPVPDLSPLAGDQVGWARYVDQVAQVWHAAGGEAVVITSNYGEAGAIDRYGGSSGLPRAYSGHNALGESGPPPDSAAVAVVVGAQYAQLEPLFGRCEVRARLDNGVGVDNEEQGVPVAVCRDPVRPWSQLWSEVRHLD